MQNQRTEWTESAPQYSGDSLEIKGYQVMQRWEDGYMHRLAEVVTSRGGHVLELGFGMGISAGYIQASPHISSHFVIECHPEVSAMAATRFRQELARGRMILINAFWEDVVSKFRDASFDGILFDTCPLDREVEFFHFLPFFEAAGRLLKPHGVFSYFSDEPREISADHRAALQRAGFKKIGFELYDVSPPAECRYWRHDTIVVPIVKK